MQDMMLQGLCELILVQAAIGQIRAFVPNRIFIANTRLFGFVWCRLLRRHLGFDSDFAQMSSPRNGGWNLWCNGYKLVFLLNLNLISKRFKLVFHWNSTGFQIYFHCYLNKVSTGFLMDFYLYSIEILTGFPIGFHWNLIEIYN